MEIIINITIFFYMLSTTGYIAYLFVQKDLLQRMAFYVLLAGFLSHSALIFYDFSQSGSFPIHNLSETLSVAGWAVACVFLILKYKFNIKILGIYAAPLITLVMVIAIELLTIWWVRRISLPSMAILGMSRLIQTVGMLWVVVRLEGGLSVVGLGPGTWMAGLRKGALWSLGFAGVAVLSMALIYLTGHNPLLLIRFPLPAGMPVLLLFFMVGGLMSPMPHAWSGC